MENVAYDAHPELMLNKMNFVLIEIMIVILGITLRILLLSILLLSAIEFILDFDCFYFLLV